MRFYIKLLFFIFLLYSCSEIEDIDIVNTDENDNNTTNQERKIKTILKDNNYDLSRFYVGTAINTNQLMKCTIKTNIVLMIY